MKQGDRVKHRLSGETFTVSKVNASIAVCLRDTPEITRFGDEVKIAVCQLKNLELVNDNQINLF